MKMMNTKTFRVSRLRKGSHISFHVDMARLFASTDLSAFDLAEPLAQYSTLVDDMADNVVRATTFVATGSLEQYDRERDLLLSTINAVVYAYHYSPLAERSVPYNTLRALMKDFKGIRYHGYMSQSAELRLLLERLREPNIAAYIDTMGLTPEVEALQRASDKFSEEVDRKIEEMVKRMQANRKVDRTTRSEADKLYSHIVSVISAHALVNPTEALEEFIRQHNGIVEVYRIIEQNAGK